MIKLTRLNGVQFFINPHLIEFMEKTPDTVITMLSEKKIIVKENCEEVIKKIIEYRNELNFVANDMPK